MKYIYFITLLILVSATGGLAQLENSGLSDSCQSTLTKLLGDKDINACFPFTSVAPLATTNKPNPDALKTAADKICGLPKCSDDLVTKTQNDIKAGCQQDLDKDNDIAKLIYYTVILYSPTRDSICFKNSTGGYCFIESLEALQQVYESAPKGQDPAMTFAGAPKEVVCTPCNKQIVNTYLNFQKSNPQAFAEIKEIKEKDLDTAKNALSGKCGADFIGNY
jgi:hypothetical protein